MASARSIHVYPNNSSLNSDKSRSDKGAKFVNRTPSPSSTTTSGFIQPTNQTGGDSTNQKEPQEPSTISNEPLLGGFALLRAVQLLNFDIYYLGFISQSSEAARLNRLGDIEAASRLQLNASNITNATTNLQAELVADGTSSAGFSQTGSVIDVTQATNYYRTCLDDLSEYNPFQKYIDRYRFLDAICRFLKICLSLAALMIGFDKTLTTIILCATTRIDLNGLYEQGSNGSMGIFVLICVNISSMYILFSTVFNGHLIWNLLSQRLFLVSRRFQYKTMLILLIFIYLEYIINISFINNLYEWEFTSNNIQSGSYSVLANLRVLVTEHDEQHYFTDIVLTVFQFVRGIIRISPYITINYTIICLKEHIANIRNQHLLTESLKRRQRLRLVVTNRATKKWSGVGGSNRKKKVNFVTDADVTVPNGSISDQISLEVMQQQKQRQTQRLSIATNSHRVSSVSRSISSLDNGNIRKVSLATAANGYYLSNSNSIITGSSGNIGSVDDIQLQQHQRQPAPVNRKPVGSDNIKQLYLAKIRSFDELESYITNLYIFTGRLNRFMSQQGLTVFFIVHNFVISVSLIVPEAARGGIPIVYLVRFLVILIAIVPFIAGQTLNRQLAQLSEQIDRIIIQQQFTHRRRDNLVRIRELIHDIRVNCGGMLNFNVETGIKYIVIALASAFFIEQEREYIISPAIV